MSAMSLKDSVPWWAKIGAKVVLSRMPARYHFWQKMNLFAHGDMHLPEYAVRVVKSHLDRVGLSTLNGRTVMELGPGDSLATAVIAKTLGAQRTILVDAGACARQDLTPYLALARRLTQKGLAPPELDGCRSIDELLARCDAIYLTDGVLSLRSIPDDSVHFVFSQAVLEHIRRRSLADLIAETYRCLRFDGVVSHTIDLQDHLGGALNNLRFPQRLWEAEWMA